MGRPPSNTYRLRHGESGNVAFADGHARAITINMSCTYVEAAVYCVPLDNMYHMDINHPPS